MLMLKELMNCITRQSKRYLNVKVMVLPQKGKNWTEKSTSKKGRLSGKTGVTNRKGGNKNGDYLSDTNSHGVASTKVLTYGVVVIRTTYRSSTRTVVARN